MGLDSNNYYSDFVPPPSGWWAPAVIGLCDNFKFIYSPALGEAGPRRRRGHGRREDISIHALCEEGDVCSSPTTYSMTYFYPRPLRGGRPQLRPRSQLT